MESICEKDWNLAGLLQESMRTSISWNNVGYISCWTDTHGNQHLAVIFINFHTFILTKFISQHYQGAGPVVKFAHSASAAQGSPVRIPGADMTLLGKTCCDRRPTYKVEEDGHGC